MENLNKNKIIILTALKSELHFLLENLSNIKKEKYFYFATYKNLNIIAAKCGLGKIKSAAFTQHCIDKFQQRKIIINFGSCGQIDELVSIGDLIYCNKTIEYDFFTLRDFLPTVKINNNIDKSYFQKFGIKQGTLLTATQNVDSTEKKNMLKTKYKGTVGDWEGAAIAQICDLNRVKVMLFKSVTDKGDENIVNDFKLSFENVMKKNSLILLDFLYFINKQGCL